jgi:hypothetical protein
MITPTPVELSSDWRPAVKVPQPPPQALKLLNAHYAADALRLGFVYISRSPNTTRKGTHSGATRDFA